MPTPVNLLPFTVRVIGVPTGPIQTVVLAPSAPAARSIAVVATRGRYNLPSSRQLFAEVIG